MEFPYRNLDSSQSAPPHWQGIQLGVSQGHGLGNSVGGQVRDQFGNTRAPIGKI